MYISIIFFSIVIAYRAKEKRVLRSFLLTAGIAFIAISVLSIFMAVILIVNGVALTSTKLVLPSSAFMSAMITGIVVYSLVSVVMYVLTKREFNKGVNVD